jgi:subfamily B ATP-binding cassette protein MsbA
MNVIRRLLPFLKPQTGLISIAIVVSMLLSALSAASIVIIWPILKVIFPASDGPVSGGAPSTAIDRAAGFLATLKQSLLDLLQSTIIVNGDQMASIRNLCLLVIAIFVLKNLMKYISGVVNSMIEERMLKSIRDLVFARTVNLSLDFFNARRGGDLISTLTNDISTMSSALTPLFGTVVREPLQAAIILISLLAFSPSLTLIAFSTSILSVVMIRVLTKHIKKYSSRMQSALGEITNRLHETFQNIRIIKGYAAERYETERFQRETSWYVRSSFKHSAVVSMMSPISEILAITALSLVLMWGGYQVIQGQMKPDELLTFLILLFAIMQPIVSIFSIPSTIQRGLVAGERVLELMDKQQTVISGTRKVEELKRELQFLNVGFSYRPGIPVVRDLTLTIKRGHTVALVGPSGGGKSTIMDLVARFYDPTDGGIYLDGVDIREFDLDGYRSLFGIVTQESILFNDTVRNNIAYNMTGATDEMVVAAARMANAHDYIMRLPDEYDTMIGDRGVLLSGGQRQRLAIARAIARNPQILLFDEATSALDTESELLVQEAINNLLIDRTAIVIAHRLSTIKNAHMIAVVEDGAIVEVGTHDQLLAAGNLYRKLYDVQFRENDL